MDDAVTAQAVWTLEGTTGKLRCGKLAGQLDVARPSNGVAVALGSERASLAVLSACRATESRIAAAAVRANDSLSWPPSLDDAYIRGSDLVASYRPTSDWPYSPQLYWQANTLSSVEGLQLSLSLLVSVQTHLLDTWPRIHIASQVPSAEAVRISISESGQAEIVPIEREERILPAGFSCGIVRRLTIAPLSYIEIMASSDFRELGFAPSASDESIAEWHLFADFLEKGVIRRARVHAALLSRKNDVELAVECCRAIEKCPLPLTT
jgi:hypothetical protein